MKCTVEVVTGIYDGLVYEFDTFPVTIGRADTNDIAINLDGAASRSHAELSFEGGTIYIDDLKSINGTYVNGTRIGGSIGKRSLNDGDFVKIGESLMKISIQN